MQQWLRMSELLGLGAAAAVVFVHQNDCILLHRVFVVGWNWAVCIITSAVSMDVKEFLTGA